MLYNNVGLISKVSENIASESIENRHFLTTPLSFNASLQRTTANIRTNLILPETSH